VLSHWFCINIVIGGFMQRKIKFRVWDKIANKMQLVESIQYTDGGISDIILARLVDGDK
jgi:hypothetical protein